MTVVSEVGEVERALHDAERDVLAVVLYSGTALPDVARGLRVEDFSNPKFRVVWEAVLRLDSRGEAIDAGTVAIELSRRDDPAVRVDRGDLVNLSGESVMPGALPTYVRHVREASLRRQLRRVRTMLGQAEHIGDAERSMEHARNAAELLDTITHQAVGTPAEPLADLVEFLDAPENDVREQVIPGVLERGERVIPTGGEGKGKSTWLRQIAVQVASGVHPFTLDPIEPQRVLLLDLENPTRHLRRELRKLRIAAGARYIPGGLIVVSRPQGLDLLDATDREWLRILVTAAQPALIVTGPLYKLASGDPTEERTARTVAQALDDTRLASDAAVMIEAHTPHASQGRNRPTRPYGASLWLRWPEFGLHLNGDTGAVTHWRGARDERDWPAALKRGGEWPWTVDHDAAHPTDDGGEQLGGADKRVLDVLRASDMPLTNEDIQTRAKVKTRETTSRSLNKLGRLELADSLQDTGWRGEKRWFAVPTQEGVMSRDEA